MSDLITEDYQDDMQLQALRDIVLDKSTWECITKALCFLSPILECIETIEADRAMISQVKDVWSGMIKLADRVQRQLCISKAHVNLERVVMERYMKGYHAVIPAAFPLDPAMSKVVNNKVLPLCGSLRSHDQEGVQTLLKRRAGNGKQDAVIAELMQFVAVGFALSKCSWKLIFSLLLSCFIITMVSNSILRRTIKHNDIFRKL
ncbi:hypothetical protein ABBQ32_004021 [Trebouxia sp. C0010 RCD-2024]